MSDEDSTDHGLPIASMDDDEPDAPTAVPSIPTPTSPITAVPELTHPGESASNGLAERAVRTLEEFTRTTIAALQQHLHAPLTMSHPLAHWAIAHSAYLLNKYMLGRDGHTAYGRLHGKETRERLCELGERVLWFVPKKLRAKADQPWRYGVFLGRALGSDQNKIGLPNGDVVRARAMVRLVPEARWSSERLFAIKTTPLTEHTRWLDKIEGRDAPHTFNASDVSDVPASSPLRRLRITYSDLRRF